MEIGTPVAFWARAEARRMFSITGVTPAVSVAHLMMAALIPLWPMPWVMSRMNRSATASTPWALKYRWGIHQTPGGHDHVHGRAAGHVGDQADVPAQVDGGQVDHGADTPAVEIGHLLLGEGEDGRRDPRGGASFPAPRGSG